MVDPASNLSCKYLTVSTHGGHLLVTLDNEDKPYFISRLWSLSGKAASLRGVPKRDRDEELAIAKAFGQRVREIRTAKGMTQEQLAEAADLHPTFVSNIERGYRVPSLPTVLRIASAFDTALDSLLDDLMKLLPHGPTT